MAEKQGQGSPDVEKYKSSTFWPGVQAPLKRMRCSGEFCDFHVNAEDGSFAIHKAVFAASSVYFRDWIRAHPGTNSGKWSLRVGHILDFVYSCEIELTESNLRQTFRDAVKWGIPSLRNVCEKFMIDSMNETNCVSFFLLADEYQLPKAKESAVDYAHPLLMNSDNEVQKEDVEDLLSKLGQLSEIVAKKDTDLKELNNSLLEIIRSIRNCPSQIPDEGVDDY